VLRTTAVIGDSATKLVLPATNEFIWGTVAFVLFLLVLWRAGVWRRLGQALDERSRRIRSDLERAEEARKEAETLLERRREELDRAAEEARRILDEARQSADQARKDILAKAQDDANRIIESAHREIAAERARAARELRGQVGELVVQVAERVVGSSLDGDRQLRLVDDYIAELERESASNGNGGRRG